MINGSLTQEEEVATRARLLGINQPLRAAMHIWIDNLTGSMRNSILALALWFIIGLILLIVVRRIKPTHPVRL